MTAEEYFAEIHRRAKELQAEKIRKKQSIMADEPQRLTDEERIARERETYEAWMERDERMRRLHGVGTRRKTDLASEAKGKRD